MSMHEIEDLVEDSIRLVLAGDAAPADRRATIAALYAVQGWFDTRDTTGWLRDELDAIGYTGGDEGKPVDLLRLAADMMAAAEVAGCPGTAQGWLALTLRALTELDLDDAMTGGFHAMLAAGDGARMRAIALRHRLHARRGGAFTMQVPTWTDCKAGFPPMDAGTLERRHVVRYLSDPKADVAAIRAGYQAEHEAIATLDTLPLFTIPQRIPALASLTYVDFEQEGGDRRFVFADRAEPPSREGARIFVVIEHSHQRAALTFQVRVQSGLLLGWQDGDGANRIADTHFPLDAFRLIPEVEREADPLCDRYGNWPFGLTQSARLLDARLAAMVAHWTHIERVRAFHATPLDRILRAAPPEEMQRRRRALRETCGFFLNDIELLFAYACLGWEHGRPDATIDAIERELACLDHHYPLVPVWREGLAIVRERIWFPPMTALGACNRVDPL